MDKKGQLGIGTFINIFIVVVVGLALFLATAQQVGPITSTTTAVNTSFTAPAISSIIDLTGQEILNTPIVINASDDLLTVTTDYVIDEGISTTSGLKSIRYTAASADGASQTVKVSYDYGVDGYIDDSGGRSLASLILIFFALAIAVVMLSPIIKEKILG